MIFPKIPIPLFTRVDIACGCLGALATLCFAPFYCYWLAPFLLAGFFKFTHDATSKRRGFRRGYVFGLGFFAAGVSWIYVSTGVYGEGGPVAGVISTIVFVAFLALFHGSLGWVVVWLKGRSNVWQYLILLPAIWVCWEWIRSWIFTGFPWLTLGYSQTEFLLGGFAPILGVFGVSLVVVILAGAIALLSCSGRSRWVGLPVALCLILVSVWLNDREWSAPSSAPLSVALIQGNIPQEKKWLPEQQLPTLRTYTSQTEDVWGTDLVVWPETAISLFYHEVVEDFLPALEEKAQLMGTDIITGIIVYDFSIGRYFNTIMTVGSTREFYAKKHLVPFGEYLPLRPIFGTMLDILGAPLDDFAPGDPNVHVLHAAGEAIGVSVCYEDAFGDEIKRALPEASLLVNISNDGWFGGTHAPFQHVQMAQMRAREIARPMLRATNTGVTAIIDHHGRLVDYLPQDEMATLKGIVVPRQGMTLFASTGNWPIIIYVLLVLLLSVILNRRRNSE